MKRRWVRNALFVLAVVVAVGIGIGTRYSVTSSGLVKKMTLSATSTTQLLVDTRYSSLAALALPATASTVTQRTPLFADYAASLPVKTLIAEHAGIALDTLSITADTTETSLPQGAGVSNSYNIVGTSTQPGITNKVTLTATDLLPVITISAEASSGLKAAALVQATVAGLQEAVTRLEKTEHVKGPRRMLLRPLGTAQGTTVKSSPSVTKTAALGVGVLIVLIILILALDNLMRGRAEARQAATLA